MEPKPSAVFRGLMTKETAEKAFERIKYDVRFAIKGYQLDLIKESRFGDMISFVRDHYLPDEPVASSINLIWDDDHKNMIRENLKYGLSIAFVDSETKEVIAGQIIALANKHGTVDTTKYKSESLIKYISLTSYFDKLFNIYEHYNVEDIVFFCQLAVHNEHRQKGIGTMLVRAAIELVKSFNIGPVVVRVEGSSNFSKRIFEKIGFTTFAEIKYADYRVDGNVLINHTGNHKSERLYGMVVRSLS